MPDEPRRDRWEDKADVPLTAAAVLFLAAYAWPILDPHLGPPWPSLCRIVTWAAWALFAVDYLARLSLSNNRLLFVRRNLLDLAAVALPLLRPLRLLRLVTLLSVLNHYVGRSLRGRIAVYVAGYTSLVVFVAALAVLDAERGHKGANLVTFGDAVWWAITTVTTVGYGDHYPVTATGRFVAAGLMLAGIALLGVVTASLASWLLDRAAQAEEEIESATRRDIETLAKQIETARRRDIEMLAAQVEALRAELAATRPSPCPEHACECVRTPSQV